MSGAEAIAGPQAVGLMEVSAPSRPETGLQGPAAPQVPFSDVLAAGLNGLETRVHTANEMVRRFAVDDTVPIHQVTAAIEEARLAVELAVQLRARFVESYRDIMNMQI